MKSKENCGKTGDPTQNALASEAKARSAAIETEEPKATGEASESTAEEIGPGNGKEARETIAMAAESKDPATGSVIPGVKKIKRTRRVIGTVLIALAVIIVLSIAAVPVVYEIIFDRRADDPAGFALADFPGLCVKEYPFLSDDGVSLAGYLYYYTPGDGSDAAAETYVIDPSEYNGLILFGHGLGGGHEHYLDCIDLFASNGWLVFAFDTTGCGNSEGKYFGGMPRQAIDVRTAIDEATSLDETSGLELVLFGHSWGGYAVLSALNGDAGVKAVVSLAGFDSGAAMMEAYGRRYAGPVASATMPVLKLHEYIKFGSVASDTALGGIENSSAQVWLIGTGADERIPYACGTGLWEASLAGNARVRITVIDYSGAKPHSNFFRVDGRADPELFGQIMEFYSAAIAAQDQ